LLKNYTLAGAIGLILGFAVVWWVRPDTSAGAVFLVVTATLCCFIAGSILHFVSSIKPRSVPRKPRSTNPRRGGKP
jgi:hypothetical protein